MSFALRGGFVGRIFGGDFELAFFVLFSPTHSPRPSPAPPGGRGEPHLAACFKVARSS